MSVAFTKEGSAETASETVLPDRSISSHPNLVTASGLNALKQQLAIAREAIDAAQDIEDINDRRRETAIPLRDARYLAERIRTAQIVAEPEAAEKVAFGTTVTFRRSDGRTLKFRIVGEDEADPKRGTISFVSPVAKMLMGRRMGDVVDWDDQEVEILAVSNS